jgi:isopentenyl-diphosphate delta-isomerase
MKDQVILVDNLDQEIGVMDKMEAHEKGLLHRAFSIFIINGRNEILLQRRSLNKYHSPGLWTNTCCSHPRPGENILEAASRRLMEEMGVKCPLQEKFQFSYYSKFSNGLIEHELDHVFLGTYHDEPLVNNEEVCDWKFSSIDAINIDLQSNPEQFTVWFKPAFKRLLIFLNN